MIELHGLSLFVGFVAGAVFIMALMPLLAALRGDEDSPTKGDRT